MVNSILKNYRIIIPILAIVSMIILSFSFDKNQMQSADCTSGYLSGGANWHMGYGWRVNRVEMENFSKLSVEERENYRFKESSEKNLDSYPFNAIGFVYIDYIARNIFFWQGDIEAVKSFQRLVHILLSIYILLILPKVYQKFLFFFLYAINPIVLYFVNFPYYYFWQVLGTSLFLIYIIRGKKIGKWIFLFSLVFAFLFITRPSTLFISLFTLLYIGYREKTVLNSVIAILIMLGVGFALKGETKNKPWHTMYIGVGAYPNEYNITLEDSFGYKKFKEETGKETLGGCKQNDTYFEYLDFIKEKYFDIVKKSYPLLIRNAFLNILESYGFGYKANYLYFNYFSAFVGAILIILLLYFKHYFLFLAIGISSISFTPYYPPLGAYMFGSYILIAYAWIVVIDSILKRRKKDG